MKKEKKISSPPILDLPEPCDVAWEAMQRGEHGRRFCDSCSKHVYDLSSMTRRDALALLVDSDWSICVNYEVDAQGQMLFKPEPPSRLQLQIEGARRLLAAAAILPVALATTACEENASRTGGDPVAVHQEHKAQAQGAAQGVIDTSTSTARLNQGASLEVSPPAHDEGEDLEKPACDGVDEKEGSETLEDTKKPIHDIPRPEPERLGGAPVAIDRFDRLDDRPVRSTK